MTIVKAIGLVIGVALVAAACAIAMVLWMASDGIDDDAGRPGGEG